MQRTGARGGDQSCLKRKVFFKNQKHQPNIVEITHLCIMHGVHTSSYKCIKRLSVSTSVGRFFEYLKNHQFQFFKYCRIKELSVRIL
jgi:hypothetical protein